MVMVTLRSDYDHTKDTPYITLKGELRGFCCGYHWVVSWFAPSQALLCNAVPHWLGANLDSALYQEANDCGISRVIDESV